MARKECPIQNICNKADNDRSRLSAGGLGTLYDDRFFDNLWDMDVRGSQTRDPGNIGRCLGSVDCTMRQVYPDADWNAGEAGVEARPSLGNPYAGLGDERN